MHDVTVVIWSYLIVNNSWPNWARASVKAPKCLEWAAESNDMQHDHPRSRYWPGQPWPGLDLISTWNWIFPKQKVYHSTRLGKTNTMVPEFFLCHHICRNYLLKPKPRHLGHWPDLWRHQLTRDLNFRYQSLHLVTPDTLVFFPRSSSSIRGQTARGVAPTLPSLGAHVEKP